MVLVCDYKEYIVIIASNELIRKHYQKSHGLLLILFYSSCTTTSL